MFTRKQTITGERLIWHWNTDIHELAYFALSHDLSIFDPANIPSVKFFFNPARYRLDNEAIVRIIQEHPEDLSEKYFWIPEIEKLTNKISLKFTRKLEAQLHYSRAKSTKQPPTKPSWDPSKEIIEKKDPELTLKRVVEAHNEDIETSPNVFSLLGKTWFAKFKDDEWGLYPDQEKFKYIAYLLDLFSHRMDKDILETSIPNIELYHWVKGKKSKIEIVDTLIHGEDLHDDVGIVKILTKDEIKRFREDINALISKIEKASNIGNDKFVQELSEELEQYKAFLMKEYGIHPRISRSTIYFKIYIRPTEEYEKLRQTIKNQINNAINDFKDRMPSFFRHLRNSIRPKIIETLYRPESHLLWHVST